MEQKRVIIVSYSAVLEAPKQKVSALLIRMPPLGRVKIKDMPLIISGSSCEFDTVLVKGGPVSYTVYCGEERSLTRMVHLDVDRSRHLTAIYGGWWYRAEYRLIPHKLGCLVIYDVCNIAPVLSRLLLPFIKEFRALRKEKKTQEVKQTFELFLQNMAEQLHCRVHSIK